MSLSPGLRLSGSAASANFSAAAPPSDDQQMARPALKLVDRTYIIRGGEVRRSGTADEIRDVALAEEYL